VALPSPIDATDWRSQPDSDGIARRLTRDEHIDDQDATTLARVITAIIHISTTATVYLHRCAAAVVSSIREQIQAILTRREHPVTDVTVRS
jgi:hypothetical protein